MTTPRPARTAGFTLVELLVVVTIVAIVSAVTLPTILPAISHRQVVEAASLLQAALASTRDGAARTNAPRGLRFLPDPALAQTRPGVLAFSQWIPIEPAPDYSEGLVSIPAATSGDPRLKIIESKCNGTTPNPPASWFWNIRQEDKIRFINAGRFYTIAGPVQLLGPNATNPSLSNVERFVNDNATVPAQFNPACGSASQYLYLVNGQDDDGDGYIDEGFDGIDNDGDGIIDPGFNGIDDDLANGVDDAQEQFLHKNPDGSFSYNMNNGPLNEFEQEAFIGPEFVAATFTNKPYTITRRPMLAERSRPTALPADVVIDATSWDAPSQSPAPPATQFVPERSRLPVDPMTHFVEILIYPNGQVAPSVVGANAYGVLNVPFYHFWLTEREGLAEPPNPLPTAQPFLPLPAGTPGFVGTPLKGERRLVTLNTNSGQILVKLLETFDASDLNLPYREAQAGVRDKP